MKLDQNKSRICSICVYFELFYPNGSIKNTFPIQTQLIVTLSPSTPSYNDAHPFACSTLLALLAPSAALIRSPGHALRSSWEKGLFL